MASDQQERRWMERALELAEGARGYAEPNPAVGAVVVRDGRIVGEGCTQACGGAHAEVEAVRDAGERARGAEMYVTLEPCAHHGKTPPCAPMLVQVGLRRVVMAVLDPTPKTGGRGLALLRESGVAAEVGLCREEAVVQNAAFFKVAATGRPLVIAKWAMSADGRIATRALASHWISGPEARAAVHEIRGMVDCVAVGGRTARRDDPLLTCRDAERRRTAARLVLCGRRLPAADSQLVRTLDEAPVLLAYPEGRPPDGLDALVEKGCEPLPVPASEEMPERVPPPALLDELGRRGMSNVLLEGGAEVLGSFFDAGQVDRVMAFVAPKVLGGREAVSAVGGTGAEQVDQAWPLHRCEVTTVGRDVLMRGWVTNPLTWAR